MGLVNNKELNTLIISSKLIKQKAKITKAKQRINTYFMRYIIYNV